jgi:hypothetical protein
LVPIHYDGDPDWYGNLVSQVSADPYELEADNFAAGLLMPLALCRRLIARHDTGLAAIEALATDCRTSLTATAIRFAELTDDAVVVVISSRNTIDTASCLKQ